jgi:hypothetical protein
MTFQTKKNVLPNPQKAPVNCAEQAHTPLSHGLLQNNGQVKNFLKSTLYPFIHNPPQGFNIDVSHLFPVFVPTH